MALSIRTTLLIDDLYTRANALLAESRPEKAEALYNQILNQLGGALQTTDTEERVRADVLHNLGMIAESRGQLDSAIAFFEKSVVVNNKRGATWLFMAKIYLDRYRLTHNSRDYYLGKEALEWAEKNDCRYPVLGWLKKEYQNAS